MLKPLFWMTFFLSLTLGATTFNPVPVEDQVKSAYGAVIASYQGKTYKKLASGQVVTELTFKISQGSGIKYSEIVNKNNFKVLVPGGEWQGVVYRVEGVPQFQQGEESFLLLSKVPEGFVVADMAMGKYNLIQENGKTYLSNSIFPKHPSLGHISLMEMNIVLEDRFGAPLEKINHDRYVYKRKNLKKRKKQRGRSIGGRAPASEEALEEEEVPVESGNQVFWLILLLGVLGAGSTVFLRKRGNF